MKAVFLAGGLGTRMREETEFKPKPMVPIGGKPVLWHLMKIYASFGITDFVVLTGYKSEIIKEYFLNFRSYNSNITVNTGSGGVRFPSRDTESWNVTVVDTGLEAETGLRLFRAKEFLEGSPFMCTYGDGLAPVDLAALLRAHQESNRLGTITVTNPTSRFGVVGIGDQGQVTSFKEKPRLDDFVNIGFMVFESQVLDQLTGENEALETGLLTNLAKAAQLNSFQHQGFWEPMDTFREYQQLNTLWSSGKAPWRTWND